MPRSERVGANAQKILLWEVADRLYEKDQIVELHRAWPNASSSSLMDGRDPNPSSGFSRDRKRIGLTPHPRFVQNLAYENVSSQKVFKEGGNGGDSEARGSADWRV